MRHDGMARSRRVGAGTVILALALAWGISPAARADDGGITVQASGVAKGKPTQVEIHCALGGSAELAADATVKFRDAKKRALAAIAALKNPDLSVKSDGLAIASSVDTNQQGQSTGKTHVQIWESNRIVLVHTDKLTPDALLDEVLKILDVAKDAGFTLSPGDNSDEGQQMGYYNRYQRQGYPTGMVSYKLPDATDLRTEAYKAAIDQAKEKAQKLADLAGVKLGRVLAIVEGGNDNGTAEGKAVVGTTTADLAVHVNLSVQFEIVK